MRPLRSGKASIAAATESRAPHHVAEALPGELQAEPDDRRGKDQEQEKAPIPPAIKEVTRAEQQTVLGSPSAICREPNLSLRSFARGGRPLKVISTLVSPEPQLGSRPRRRVPRVKWSSVDDGIVVPWSPAKV